MIEEEVYMSVKKNILKEKDINKIATNLILKDGIWFSKKNGEVSYPQKGNALYANIEEASFWFFSFWIPNSLV